MHLRFGEGGPILEEGDVIKGLFMLHVKTFKTVIN